MAESAEPRNGLEEVLRDVHQGNKSNADFIHELAESRVYVLMNRPWDGKTAPPPDTHMLVVSDGANHEQPMLALFTDASRAHEFKTDTPGYGVVGMDAAMAFLGVHDGTGVMVNPNNALGYRLTPEGARMIREAARTVVEEHRQQASQSESRRDEPES